MGVQIACGRTIVIVPKPKDGRYNVQLLREIQKAKASSPTPDTEEER